MNVGIITFYWAENIGANLQCYALKKFLESMGHTVYVIQHRGKRVFLNEDKMQSGNFPYFKKKTIKYNAFAINNFNLSPMVSDARFKSPLAKLKLDVVICGSDQVWSKEIVDFNPTFFGGDFNGTSDVTLASYAASLGSSDLSDESQKQNFQSLLRGFDYISVREYTQSDLLAEAIGQTVEICLDPTLLLGENYYLPIMAPRLYDGRYVYNHYYYHENLAHLYNFTAKLLEAVKLSLVVNMSKPNFKFDETVVDGTEDWAVEEALSAIYHSEYITTSSFHAVAFSIIFKKRFWYILKGDATDRRIIDLLTSLGLVDRIIDGEQPLPDDFEQHPDWVNVYSKLWQMRKKSIDYLYKITSSKRKKRIPDYLTSGDEFTCYCCNACADRCPVGAIAMETNSEGFTLPVIDKSKCTDCGLCHKVCPYNIKPRYDNYEPQAYLSFSKEEEILTNSSSGGMYQTFANEILARKGYVTGVAADDSFVAYYDLAKNKKGSKKFRYSKYVEPAHGDIYNKTEKALERGKPVLFTGSPCKIAGLKNYLGKDYDNLYTLEIICHGTPSPLALSKWLEAKGAEHGGIKHFQHRSTKLSSRAQASEYVYNDGFEEVIPITKDDYMGVFLRHIVLKKSCHQCEFCKENKISDITIGDFWGSEKVYKEDVYKGVSCLIVNTPKGKKLLERVKGKLYLQEQTIRDIYSANHASPSKIHKNRARVFQLLNEPDANAVEVFKKMLGRQ